MRQATIREVATRAGVSVATVSRVLNGYPFVSDDARRRVVDAVEEFGYRPDVAARSMRTGTTRAVGLVVSDFSNPLFSTIAKGADTVLGPHGYSLVLANSMSDRVRESEAMAALRQRRVDGLIVAVADERARGLADRLDAFTASVLIDREVPASNADAVCSEHASGIAEALAYLARLGHRRVALVAGSKRQLGSRARIESFLAERPRLGLDEDDSLLVTGELSPETGYLAATRLLALEDPPTALVAGNNQLVVGAISALRDLGLRIPDDVSLVGCDDTDLTRLHDPPIDVVSRDLLALGRTAAELLLARLLDPAAPPRRVTLPSTFVPRASSASLSRLEEVAGR
jgi:LacI family transcriptional regulator